jgi:hypothetical protein
LHQEKCNASYGPDGLDSCSNCVSAALQGVPPGPLSPMAQGPAWQPCPSRTDHHSRWVSKLQNTVCGTFYVLVRSEFLGSSVHTMNPPYDRSCWSYHLQLPLRLLSACVTQRRDGDGHQGQPLARSDHRLFPAGEESTKASSMRDKNATSTSMYI